MPGGNQKENQRWFQVRFVQEVLAMDQQLEMCLLNTWKKELSCLPVTAKDCETLETYLEPRLANFGMK